MSLALLWASTEESARPSLVSLKPYRLTVEDIRDLLLGGCDALEGDYHLLPRYRPR